MTSEFVVLMAGLREATREGHCPRELETAGPFDFSRFNQGVCRVRTTLAPEGSAGDLFWSPREDGGGGGPLPRLGGRRWGRGTREWEGQLPH